VWGLGQLVTGAASDRLGRKRLIVGGMGLQAAALTLVAAADSFAPWALAAVALGAGTAMVYPTLLAAIGDVAHPAWRARSVGVYRLWRDAGFAVGGLVGGVAADAYGLRAAVLIVAGLTAASGALVAARMYETHPDAAPLPDPAPGKAGETGSLPEVTPSSDAKCPRAAGGGPGRRDGRARPARWD
jgi:MFS family permease